MRIWALIGLVVLVMAPGAFADEKPPLDIAIYPGGQTSLEINLTHEELAPMLEAMLPLMGDKLGKWAGKIKPEDIAEALSGLKRIELVQVDVKKADMTELDLAAYYSKTLPPGKWSRLFWQTNDRMGTIGLYSLEGFQGFYGFRITREQVEGKPVYRAMVGKIEGTIDFVKVLALVGKIVMAP